MGHHHFHSIHSGTDISHQGEGRENVDNADRIIQNQGSGVTLRNLRAIACNQIRKNCKKGNGGIVGYDLHELHHNRSKALQKFRHLLSCFSG